jgi:Flp pilus assembly protein TadG
MRKGVAAVECALVMPFLVFLILGTVEVGRYIQVTQIITNATREGSRAYAQRTPLGTPQYAIDTVQLCIKADGFDPTLATVTPSQKETPFGTQVQVDVSIPYVWYLAPKPFMSVALFPPFMLHCNVHSVVVFRKEVP